jgi:hypothetical protein
MTNLSETPMPEQKPAKPPMSPRAKRYWGSFIGAGLLGLLIGGLLSPHTATVRNAHGKGWHGSFGDILNMHLDPALGIIIALLWGLGMTLIMILYLRNVDEQEMHANLWAGMYASNVLLIGMPVWQILWMAGFVPPVDIWTMYLMVAVVIAVTWAWLKFRR